MGRLDQKPYRVMPTERAKRDGRKLLRPSTRAGIINRLRHLASWPESTAKFEFEKAFGALEFKFHAEDKWIRVFIYPDEVRRVMWVLRVFAKKTNDLPHAYRVSVQDSLVNLLTEIESLGKRPGPGDPRHRLRVIPGGKK